jgi:hypothetical protein
VTAASSLPSPTSVLHQPTLASRRRSLLALKLSKPLRSAAVHPARHRPRSPSPTAALRSKTLSLSSRRRHKACQ